jgi:hypothetical protein
VCVCDHDLIAPPRAAIRAAERAPSGQLLRYPIRPFDLFAEPWLDRVLTDQIGFLCTTLLGTNGRGGEDPHDPART